ncbi:uncharacterized protein LOC121718556 [Alosa sapidissima]|uniref:uncharacterized protein LOC121718556 n=1 Tax=Alosa sapidissima TaxID=34773 RepID=UPI001C08232E|nr:uncharacterized protein LOC121718556 [Alosa sapidissima]
MIKETEKKKFDSTFVKETMALTFSFRRQEVVDIEPLVTVLRDRWPALFFKDEICSEFYRITNIDLMVTFQSSLEKFTPALMKYYRKKKEPAGSELTALLAPLDDQVSDIMDLRKRVALEGLPLVLKEESGCLFRKCLETDAEEIYTRNVKIGILTVLEDDVAVRKSLPTVINIAIILEETVVLEDIKDLPSAVAYLFGLLYATNMEYPKDLSYTFEVIQKVFVELDAQSCSSRALSLRRKLYELLR